VFVVGESPSTDGSGSSWREVTPAAGFLANELVNVRRSVVASHADGEIATGAFELHGGNRSGAVEWVQTRA